MFEEEASSTQHEVRTGQLSSPVEQGRSQDRPSFAEVLNTMPSSSMRASSSSTSHPASHSVANQPRIGSYPSLGSWSGHNQSGLSSRSTTMSPPWLAVDRPLGTIAPMLYSFSSSLSHSSIPFGSPVSPRMTSMDGSIENAEIVISRFCGEDQTVGSKQHESIWAMCWAWTTENLCACLVTGGRNDGPAS